MKPPPFEYQAPRTVDEALALLAQHGDSAKVLAGGQSLMPLLNFRLAQPEALVDINRLADLAYVRAVDTGLAIGALTRQHAVERSERRPGARADPRRGVPLDRATCPSATAAPSAAASPTPIRPPSCRRDGRAGGRAHPRPEQQPAHRAAPTEFFPAPLTTALEPDELLDRGPRPRPAAAHGGAFVEMRGAPATSRWQASRRWSRSTHPAAATRARLALCGVGPTPIRAREARDALLGGERPAGSALDDGGEPRRRGDRSAERRPRLGRRSAEARPSRRAARPSSWPRARQGGAHDRTTVPIGLTVNGIRHELTVEPRWLLVDLICARTSGLTGTHIGCEHGVCGTCTVLLDGETRAVVPDAGRPGRRRRDHHGRGPGGGDGAASRCRRRSARRRACSAGSARRAC